MLLQATTTTTAITHATILIQFLITTYFSKLSSVLIVHNACDDNNLQAEYLHAVESAFRNQSQHGNIIGLQWICVAQLNRSEFENKILQAVDIVTEGFITILSNTTDFLHARYYATRNAKLRLKDKFYLFLCEHENPKDFLATEILQFYPHHLMVTPATPTTTTMEHVVANIAKQQQQQPKQTKPYKNTNIFQNKNNNNNNFKSHINSNVSIDATFAKSKSKISSSNSSSSSSSYAARITTLLRTTKIRRRTTATTSSSYHDINFEMWTQKFIGTIDHLDAVLLSVFLPNKTFTNNVELYPDKVSNLKGRTMRVGSITYIPYVVTNYVAAGVGDVDPIHANKPNRSVSYIGSEAEIVKTFCRVRNCHLRVQPYGADNWGIIYENGTSSGMLGDVYKQRVELAIGCIYNWYNNKTETSNTIARSAVTILGPAPAQFPAWRTNIMPFDNDLWTFLITTMFLCALTLYFINFSEFRFKKCKKTRNKYRHFDSFKQTLMDIFAVFIQQPSAQTRIRSFAGRIFLATILCATITLENTYSGQLKSILTIPFYTDPVDTMDKWSQTDWQWAAPSIVWVQTVAQSDLLKEQILSKKFHIHDYDFLYNASFRADYGLGIERLLSGAFSFGDFITAPALETKIVPKDDLYFDWTRAVSIRGWPLMPLFNKHVRACMETGLFVHWERQIVADCLNRQIQNIMRNLASGHTSKMPPQKLTVENISGAFFALLLGYVIATILFLTEYFMRKLHINLIAKFNFSLRSFLHFK